MDAQQQQNSTQNKPRNVRDGAGPKSTGNLHYTPKEGAARLADAWTARIRNRNHKKDA